ncbi:GIY-YIG nuclease family protein [Helicobacter sp. T3_23-1059]
MTTIQNLTNQKLRMENLSQKLLSLPNTAGVYQYIDSSGRVLYIGKAKSLKKRVKSYFSLAQTLQSNTPIPNPKVSLRIASMVRQVANIEILLVNSEQDALILENSLIKQLKPKYNVLLRDDKTYPYIAFDFGLDFPMPTITRNINQTKSTTKNTSYFGPFTSGAKEIINSLLELYPLVQKSSCVREKKACLFYQIGRCSAPCEGKISKESYANIIDDTISLLKSPHKLLAKLKEKMLSLAESRRYEEAGVYRDRIKKLQNLQSFSALDLAKDVNVDVLYLYMDSFSEGNSSLGSHCRDFVDFEGSQATQPSSPPKSTKNSTSTTAPNGLRAKRSKNTRIVVENGGSDCLIASEQGKRGNPQKTDNINSPSPNCQNVAGGTINDKKNSPSLAEGARGRVKSSDNPSLLGLPKASRGNPQTKIFHIDGAQKNEVSKSQLKNRDILLTLNMTNNAQCAKSDKNGAKIDCHAQQVRLAMTELANDCYEFAIFDKNANFHNDDIKHTTKPCNNANQNPQTQKAILLSLFVRGGKIISIQHEIISLNQSQIAQNQPKESQSEIYAQIYTQAILNQYSSKLPIIPSEILLPSIEGLPCEVLSDFLYSTQGRKIAINAPQIGTKAKILSLAKQNAKEILGLHCAKLDKENALLERLALNLELESSPSRIEVFDTSHHSGKDCVGAMIVYENGEFVKSAYRRYKLSGSDEYSQMREMLVRRAKDFASTPPPNLWLIDGGKPQIALAKEVLESCGLNGAIDIVGIAKQKRLSSLSNVDFAPSSQTDFVDFAKSTNKTATKSIQNLTLKSKSSKYANRAKGAASDILYTLSNTFAFSPSDEKLQFLQKLRDEAHRFAITFHREKKKTSALEANALKKRNLSQAQIKRLLSLVGSFKDIQNLSDEEIKNLLKSKRTAQKSD